MSAERRNCVRDSRLLLLAALIVGAPCAFHAAPAAAQTTVWSAALTVDVAGVASGCTNYDAAQDNCSSASVLTQDEFTRGGVTYRVALARRTGFGLLFQLAFEGLSGAEAKAALGTLTLNVDGRRLAVGRAITSPASGLRHLLGWTLTASPRWRDGQRVSLSLTAPAAAPAKPAGFTARAGNAGVALRWSDPRDSGIAKYQYRQQAGADPWGAWTDIPDSAPGRRNATSYTVTGLTEGVAYRFRIRAVSAGGNGAESSVAGPVTPAGAPPPVVPPTMDAVWSATLTVDRSDMLATRYGCGPLPGMDRCTSASALTDDTFTWGGTTYQVKQLYWRSDLNRLYLRLGSLFSTPLRSARGSLTLSVEGHRIVVGDTVSASSLVSWPFDPRPDWTEGQRVRVSLADTPTMLPLNGLRAAAGDGEVALNWDNPNFYREGRPPVTYRWEYRQRAGGGPWGAWTVFKAYARYSCNRDGRWMGPEESAVVRGLENGTAYSFEVRSRPHRTSWLAREARIQGWRQSEAPVSATPRGDLAPVRVTPGPGNDRLTVAWSPELRAEREDYGSYGGYRLRWKTDAQAWDDPEVRGTSVKYTYGTNWLLRNLEPGTAYTMRVWWNANMDHRDRDTLLGEATGTSGTEPEAAPPPAGPALEWARVNGAELALRFDEALDESSAPSASAFAVSVAGSARSVSSVTVREALVILTLDSPVTSGEAVTVGYTPPSTGKLRLSGGGAAVAAFSGQTVANDTLAAQPQGQPQVQLPPEAVEPPAPEPLTARFESAPSEHRGKGQLSLRIAFSAPVAARAKDAGVQVSGGTLARAVRVDGRKDLWKLTVNPSGYGAVTVRLPATADCAAAGAVCTADGRRLETALSHTVQGPVALSVADASAKEGPGASMDFAVTLSRAASGEVTVAYATRNGTAKKGKDYAKTKGTLAFAPGETAKTVSVALLDDAHDEGAETFRLVLKKATGAVIADGEAVGTIENADPLQKDWLARFGRAAASDAVAAVTARLETPRDAGSHLTLGGQRLSLDGSGLSPEPAGGPGGADWLSWSGEPAGGHRSRTISGRELLMGTSFRAVLGGEGSQWTSWGQGASVSQFSSATPSLSLSGETATGSLGMDYEHGRLLTGFAMTHSLGEGTARGSGRSYLMGSAVTTMLPYARVALSDRVSAWGLAGTGSGRLTLDLDGGARERYGADLSMTLAATGVRGELVTPAEPGGFALALKADAFWVRTESESVSTPEAGNLAGARAEASRVRAVLDGSRSFALAGGGTLTPSVELGLRRDGGDAETGTGYELGAGIGYADPSRGLDMAFRVHGLAGHADDGYAEWGVSGSLRLVPGAADRGLSASLTPSWGADPGGTELLWAMPDAHALAANDDAPLSSRLDAEVGYGIAMFGGGFTGTPNVGMGLSDTARELRMGWRLAQADGGDFELHLDAARREAVNEDAPEHRIGVGLTARW